MSGLVCAGAPVSAIARQLTPLLFQAIEDPGAVDRGALRRASNAFLDAAPAGQSGGCAMARQMAAKALDWRVLDGADNYAALCRAFGVFRLHSLL